jgi:hypothetical protein
MTANKGSNWKRKGVVRYIFELDEDLADRFKAAMTLKYPHAPYAAVLRELVEKFVKESK